MPQQRNTMKRHYYQVRFDDNNGHLNVALDVNEELKEDPVEKLFTIMKWEKKNRLPKY